MKTILFALVICLAPAMAQDGPLKQVQTLPLAKIEGHLGHLAVDVKSGRLFVAATEANTVEVFDLKQGTLLQSVAGFSKPQDILVIPGSTRVYVSNGDGKLRIFDTATWQQLKAIELGGGAGYLSYDATAKRVYAAEDGGLAIIDPVSGNKVSEVKLDGRPEVFQSEKAGSRIFVNMPETNGIAVVDKKKPGAPAKIAVTWAKDNYTMALDERNHRLLVGARKPAKLLVLDTAGSNWVTELPIGDDVGDIFYDAAQKRVYVISGSAIVVPDRVGLVYVLDQHDPDHYMLRQKLIATVGAHTGLFVPELHRLYVAVPHAGDKAAEVRVYETTK